ncbi:MAG: pyridoxal phosphate-dependent aminotransferase [Planctomycetota bacterium]
MLKKRATRLIGESAFEVLARAKKLEAQGREVIHLEIGQPDFPTPAHVREAAKDALDRGQTGYGPSSGLPELRQAVASHAGQMRNIEIGADRVVIAPGAKPLLFYGINALGDAGDEILYPDPGFPMYRSLVAHSGATPVPLPLHERNGFVFDPDEFKELVSEKTSLVILNSPQNPSGGVLSRSDLEVVAAAANEYDFYVLSDEIYAHFSYDAPFESIASLPGMQERTIIVDGFSKAYAMTGWRLGFAILPVELAKTFDLYNVNIASCACTFGQIGAVAALEGTQEPLREMVAEFRTRRDYLVSALNELPGVRCLSPGGAFYAFPNIEETGRTSRDLASSLLEDAGVAVLSGDSFGPNGEGFLRLSYANSLENLKRAVERMTKFLA